MSNLASNMLLNFFAHANESKSVQRAKLVFAHQFLYTCLSSITMRLSYWRWLGPIPAAFVLQAVHGLLYAYGIFVSEINNVIFTKAIGLIALFVALGITFFGILLHYTSDPIAHHSIPRLLTILGAILLSAQSLMSYGLVSEMNSLVYIGAGIVGIGSGIIAVVSIIMMQSWAPDYPAIITGLGLLFGGGGTLLGISCFEQFSNKINDPIQAFGIIGLLQTIIAILSGIFIERPPTGWNPLFDNDDEEYFENEMNLLLPDKDSKLSFDDNKLSIFDILSDSAFYKVCICLCAGVGPGFGLVLGFPKMVKSLFGLSNNVANDLLFWVTMFGVVGRIGIGLIIDLLSSEDEKYGFIGSKVVNQGLLILQCIAFACIPICIKYEWTNGFTLTTCMVFITFNGSSVIAASMSRSVFSAENSTLAFALLGIAMGIGRALFSMVIAFCSNDTKSIFEFDSYLHIAFLFSAIGLIVSYHVVPSQTAYSSRANSSVFVDLKV